MTETVISIFPNVFETKKPFDRSLRFIFDRIKNGHPNTRSIIEEIRQSNNKTRRDNLKVSLPNFSFSGQFKQRNSDPENLISYSGLVLIDFDKVEDLPKLRADLTADPFSFAVFLSVSGRGYKLLVQTDNKEPKNHKRYVQAIWRHYSQYAIIDEQGSGLVLGTYESYDPDLFVNPTAEEWTECDPEITTYYAGKKDFSEHPEFSLMITDEYALYREAVQFVNKWHSFSEGSRNHYIFRLAYACNKLGISATGAESQIVRDYIETGFPEREIRMAVKSGYKDKSVSGTVKLRDREKYEQIRQLKRDGADRGKIIKLVKAQAKEQGTAVKDETIESAIDEVEGETKEGYQTFWDTFQKDPDKIETPWTIKINYAKFQKWFRQIGVYLYYPADDRETDYMFIKTRNNIVSTVEKAFFPQTIKNYITKLPPVVDNVTKADLLNYFTAGVDGYVSRRKLEMLDETQIRFFQDDKDTCNFFFRNAIARVTESDIILLGYEQLDECVWEKKIVKSVLGNMTERPGGLEEFLTLGKGKFDFGDWLFKTCDSDMKAAKNLCAVLGYLCHNYKDQANPRAVVFQETPMAGNPEGGTGKGILIQTVQQLRNVIRENGKIANPKDKFWAQSIKIDTDIFCIEDVQKNFDFEDIFSVITDGITVEDKFKSKFYIPYERSPKIVITTNYPLRGSGSSHDRRKYEIELSHAFKQMHKDPISYYGKRFFSADWLASDWQLFYYFMFECARYYLSLKGEINIVQSEALSIRKFIRNTSHDWISFVGRNIDINTFYSKRELHEKYLEFSPAAKRINISVQKVSDYTRELSKFIGCQVTEKTVRNKRGFVLEPSEYSGEMASAKLISLRNESGEEYNPEQNDGNYYEQKSDVNLGF